MQVDFFVLDAVPQALDKHIVHPPAFVESFNGKFRDTCLNQHWFLDLADARQTLDAFRAHYNDIRPHSSLNYQPPAVFARQAA